MNDSLIWLQSWYEDQCNGDWEHQYGIKIETIDNPGWMIVIDLNETDLDGKVLSDTKIERSEHDWLHYRLEGSQFIGFCGPANLSELLNAFRLLTKTCQT